MKLYEIAAAYRQLCADLEAAESGEVTEQQADAFAGLTDQLDVKARNIVGLIRELKVASDAIADEAKRLMVLSQVKKNAADRLKAYLLECLQTANVPALDVGIAKVRVQKAGTPSITWDRDEPIPEEFEKWTVALDSKKAHDALKANLLPEGFKVSWTTFLMIR